MLHGQQQQFTNVQRVFLDEGNPYARVNMDTWYYSEWVDPAQSATVDSSATLGKAVLGDCPLIPTRGVVAFVARQVFAFREAFSGLFRPTSVTVGYKPRLTGVEHHPLSFPVPERPEDVEAIQAALEQHPYEGITSLGIAFEVRATVRDGHGELSQTWLPYAGAAFFHARYTEGLVSNLPRSVAVTYLLTPSAQEGIAPWTVDLQCSFISLFRETNVDVLGRARARWRRWLKANPTGVAPRKEDDEAEDTDEEWTDYVVTLAEPPGGTPPDNRELYERNAPMLRAAIGRWEESLGVPFEWGIVL